MMQEPKQLSVMLVCDYSLSYLGGAQVAFLRQVKALLREGWSVTVVAPGAKKALANNSTPLLTIIEPQVLGSLPGVDLPVIVGRKKMGRRLKSLLAEGRIKGVVVHSEFALATTALRAAKTTGVPVLQTVHTFFWRAPSSLNIFAPLVTAFHRASTGLPATPKVKNSSPINNALRSMTLRFAAQADGVLSPSQHQAQQLLKAGAKNVHAFSNVTQKLDCGDPPPKKPLQIVWAGRFAPEKRLNVALDAMKLVARQLGDDAVTLHVAGGESADQPGVHVHGRLENKALAELIKDSHAVLVTSLGFDNQPMIALEGFSKCRPVIVTDPALKEEFADAAILTLSPDAEGLAKTIIALTHSGAPLEKAAAAAREYAAQRTASKHSARLLEIFTTARN